MVTLKTPEYCGTGRQLARTNRLNLGLALLQRRCLPGVPLTTEQIAAWCDCSRQAISAIEKRALKKLRNHLWFQDPASRQELMDAFTTDRQTARHRTNRAV